MTANYHTHTYRCLHACGEDEEYVKVAIERGVQVLGFSDHSPINYPNDYVCPHKMTMGELAGYVNSVNELRRKYAGKIEIHLGLEAEYYEETFEKSLKEWRDAGIEYLILGQHYVVLPEWERGTLPSVAHVGDEALISYVEACTRGMRTGKFSYLAHPDILRYSGENEALYDELTRRLIACAIECDMPLEINMLGLRTGRHYPAERFWKIAKEYSPKVILGADAHSPQDLAEPKNVNQALLFAKKYNLKLIDRLDLKAI